MIDRLTFWMVYGGGQGAPTVRHQNYSAAKAEAERLARTNPGIEFIVLRAVSISRKHDVETIEFDDLPF